MFIYTLGDIVGLVLFVLMLLGFGGYLAFQAIRDWWRKRK
jgi:hypothetical protein